MTSSVQGHPLATSTPAHPSLAPNNAQTVPSPPGTKDPIVSPNPSAKDSAWGVSAAQSETPVAGSGPAPGLRGEGGGAQGVGLDTGIGLDPNVLVEEDDFGECVVIHVLSLLW